MTGNEAEYLTKKEITELLNSKINVRDKIIIRLFYETGCTLKELVLIKIKDLDFKENKITIQAKNIKNNLVRKIIISKTLTKKLFLHTQNNSSEKRIFESRQEEQLTERRVQQIIASHSKQIIGKKISPRDLRVTHIIHAFLDQKPIEKIEKTVGIRNIQPYIYSYFKQK
ncbi:MAG: site-specific integrase [Nanoarchaeota archaeon]|nr:site-specific integrase [Nanoarchaeota archaeon]MBU1030750.1 site-specific integrase [Nanoarchaeota archaeon]MBU1850527.1 site-specific integrase [Nanoarchaeota archaeon]